MAEHARRTPQSPAPRTGSPLACGAASHDRLQQRARAREAAYGDLLNARQESPEPIQRAVQAGPIERRFPAGSDSGAPVQRTIMGHKSVPQVMKDPTVLAFRGKLTAKQRERFDELLVSDAPYSLEQFAELCKTEGLGLVKPPAAAASSASASSASASPAAAAARSDGLGQAAAPASAPAAAASAASASSAPGGPSAQSAAAASAGSKPKQSRGVKKMALGVPNVGGYLGPISPATNYARILALVLNNHPAPYTQVHVHIGKGPGFPPDKVTMADNQHAGGARAPASMLLATEALNEVRRLKL